MPQLVTEGTARVMLPDDYEKGGSSPPLREEVPLNAFDASSGRHACYKTTVMAHDLAHNEASAGQGIGDGCSFSAIPAVSLEPPYSSTWAFAPWCPGAVRRPAGKLQPSPLEGGIMPMVVGHNLDFLRKS